MPQIPIPSAKESENDFIVRAHKALAREIPDTDRRNAAVFTAWRQSRGLGELEKKACEQFDDQTFTHRRDVPVFTEHEYTRKLRNPDGSPKVNVVGTQIERQEKYDLKALKAICDRCNYRIADTGNFAMLSEGHTPDADQRYGGAREPPILGFAGPFRIGMIGNKEPRWAIFQDEHYLKSETEKVRRLPTRSPEVWLKDEMADRFLDPIAMLGADTPKLDMGLRFQRLQTGEQVEKYAAAATTVVARKPLPKPEKSDMAISAEDVEAIVGAVMQTDIMQFVKGLMESQMGANGTVPPAPPAPVPQKPTAGPPPVAPPGPPDPVSKYSRQVPCNRQIADEIVDVVRMSREAGQPVSFEGAREAVRDYYYSGAEKHRYHKFRTAELYRLEDQVEETRRRASELQVELRDSSSKATAERCIARVQAERERGNHDYQYEDARAELLGKAG